MKVQNRKMCNDEENRCKLCTPCGLKIKFGNENPDKFLVNEKIKLLIQKYVKKLF